MTNQFADPGHIRTRHAWIDNLLPVHLAQNIYQGFPPITQMRYMNTFREKKYTTKAMEKVPAIVKEAIFAFQDAAVLQMVEQITGMRAQRPDPHLYAGGLSAMVDGHFLHPHVDNSHDLQLLHYRTLNLLYYVTPEWKEEHGGNLELWDERVCEKKIIPSLFNRLVIMETNRYSWHGVSAVTGTASPRTCVSNYYFSENSPDGEDYFHITAFSAPPGHRCLRFLSQVDNCARTLVRKLVPRGLGKKDIFIKN